MKYINCTPAYGRDYASKKEVLAAYEAGQDFEVHDMRSNGAYINKHDVESSGEEITLNIRYKKMMNVCVIKG